MYFEHNEINEKGEENSFLTKLLRHKGLILGMVIGIIVLIIIGIILLNLNNKDNQLEYAMVNLNANGGVLSGDINQVQVKIGSTYGDLPVPTREGYTFIGWYTKGNNGTKVENDSLVLKKADYTLYAYWTANTYIITFDVSNGTVNPASIIVTYNSTYGELPTPAREGYTFNGWYTKENDEGIEVKSDTLVSITANQILYAHWAISDTTLPTCSLSVNSSVITATVSDDNEIVYQGWDSLFLGDNSVDKKVAIGTHIYYVKDASGNTNTCSINIVNTVENKSYYCQDNSYTLSGTTCTKTTSAQDNGYSVSGSCGCKIVAGSRVIELPDNAGATCKLSGSTAYCSCPDISSIISEGYATESWSNCTANHLGYSCNSGTLSGDKCIETQGASLSITYSCSTGTKIDDNYCYYY